MTQIRKHLCSKAVTRVVWAGAAVTIVLACVGPDDEGSTEPRTLKGEIALRATMTIPEELRADALANRSTIAALGAELAEDGSSVSFGVNAGGRVVAVGEATALVDADNTFTIELAADAPTEGTVFDHMGEVPWGKFDVSALAAEGSTPTPIEIPFEIQGGCCMDGETDPCCATAPKGSDATAKTDPSGLETTCLDYDGPLFPGANASEGNKLNYLGSTCYLNVVNGCCANENGTIAFQVLDRATFEAHFGEFVPCGRNHKGRYCQEISKGDVDWRPSGEIEVALGETTGLLLHNNGCFGVTRLIKHLGWLGGELTGDHYDGLFVRHYADSGGPAHHGGFVYEVNQRLDYEAPKCVDNTILKDTYTARVDGSGASLDFVAKRENLWRFTTGASAGMIFSGDRAALDGFTIAPDDEGDPDDPTDGCAGDHVHGAHPCSGLADPDERGCGHGQVVSFTE